MAAPAPRDPRRGTSRPGANSRGSDRRYALPTRWRTRSRSRSPASRSADARPVGPRRDPRDPGPAWRRRRAARSRLEGDRASTADRSSSLSSTWRRSTRLAHGIGGQQAMMVPGDRVPDREARRRHLVEPQVRAVIAAADLHDSHQSLERSVQLDVPLQDDRVREEGILARAEAELRVGILDLERHHYRDAEARQDAHQPVERLPEVLAEPR